MDALLDYLDDIEEVLDTSKSLPFTNKISVEKDRILEILSEIRLNLPDDIRSAQRILGDHDRIVTEAQRKAQDITDSAENDAKVRTSNHEIFRRASDQASELLGEARKEADDIGMNVRDYADDTLADVEEQIKKLMANLEEQHKNVMDYYHKMIEIIYENRKQLRGGR